MKQVLRIISLILLAFAVFILGKALLYGRWTTVQRSSSQRVELSYEKAMDDGILSPLEIATHYAPEVHAAVNVLISSSGKGPYESNPCSYRLEPLSTLWAHRNGPYGEGHIFSSYGAFAGDNYRKNAANPAWAWRNKTQFGFGGSFLSDPAWTFSRAVDGFSFSSDYLLNPYADWKVTIHSASAGKKITTLRLWQDGWQLSSPDWWMIHEDGTVEIAGENRNVLWIAAPRNTAWRLEAVDYDGKVITNAEIAWTTELILFLV